MRTHVQLIKIVKTNGHYYNYYGQVVLHGEAYATTLLVHNIIFSQREGERD